MDNRSNLIASGQYDKALIKNLRTQSPFADGTRNRDFVNPSLTSNVVFYNHGLEKVDNPHIKVPKHEWRPSGYNLEDYVAQDAQRNKDLPFKPASDRKFAEVPRRNVERPKIDDDARSNAPERHYQRSQRSASSSQRAHSANDNRRGSQLNDKPEDPTHWNAKTQTRETATPPERSVRSTTAERKELRAPSEHSRLPRQELRAPSEHSRAAKEEHAVRADNAPAASGEIVYDLGHNKIGNLSKDKQPIVVIDKDGNSRCGTVYEKVTDSQMSNPDNLICDNCANKNMAEDKVMDARAQREQDMQFARQVSDAMRQQLEDERKRQLDKLRMYQGAIDNQLKDQIARKEAEKAAADAENEKLRDQMNNRDDEIARLEKEKLKKQNFIGDLKNQMDDKRRADQNKRALDDDEDKRNPNLLIDDGWRQPHREAMKDYYKNYLIDQVNEQERNKDWAKNKQKEEDEEYKRKLAQLNADEAARKRDMDDEKRRVFMDEVQKQLAEKEKIRDWENEIKNAEDDNLRKKLERDRQVYLDNVFKKKAQMDDYLNNLGKQIVDKDMEKRIAELERKKRYNTTLCLGKKPVKCYNCAVCRSIYPLKYLNKKHKLA